MCNVTKYVQWPSAFLINSIALTFISARFLCCILMLSAFDHASRESCVLRVCTQAQSSALQSDSRLSEPTVLFHAVSLRREASGFAAWRKCSLMWGVWSTDYYSHSCFIRPSAALCNQDKPLHLHAPPHGLKPSTKKSKLSPPRQHTCDVLCTDHTQHTHQRQQYTVAVTAPSTGVRADTQTAPAAHKYTG
jgi:hypothetical protein